MLLFKLPSLRPAAVISRFSPVRKKTGLLLLAMCSCVLLLHACLNLNPDTPEPPAPPPQAVKSAPVPKTEEPKGALYASMDNFRLRVLRQSEARALAGNLDPGRQGLVSWNDLKFSLEQSLAYVIEMPEDDAAVIWPTRPQTRIRWKELRQTLTRLLELLPQLDENPHLLASEFRWLAFSPEFGFTGYYEPTINASYRPSPMYAYPLYARPPELKPGVRFLDRHSIDRKQALAGRGLELAWVRDDLDSFFLQIQGSGRLVFPDGKVKHVLYDGKNGHPYVAIGRVLREKGLLDENNVSMSSIRACLLDNPLQKSDVLDSNPSYVFFRLDDKGPYGGMGRILTPTVSIAVDPRVLPYGSLLFFNTRLPNQLGVHNRPFNALALPQDTGGAIKGRRIDIFMGAGLMAEQTAGFLNHEGTVYMLLAR